MTVRLALLAAVFVAGCGTSGPAVEPEPPMPPELPPRVEVVETAARTAEARTGVVAALAGCRSGACGIPVGSGVEVESVAVERDTVVVRLSRDLGDAPVRTASAAAFDRAIARSVRRAYPGVPVRVETRGDALAALIPNAERAPAARDASRRFAPPVTGPPLTRPDAALPAAGLAGRHVALWPSHGWLYNATSNAWGWQRPRLFTTVEDLLTVGFVTRELAPMMERAGAVTLLPRERDPQPAEVIVDDGAPGYAEAGRWVDGPAGFGARAQYGDGVLPFRAGRSRAALGGSAASHAATWTPDLPHAGPYAVHVSYAAGPDRSEAARYRVSHAGGATDVLVNQTMGAGTWVYLGTFEFEAGLAGSVTLTAETPGETVSADAVRFGGGLGIVAREGQTSGRPRWLEAARYYEQFAGAPPSVYNITGAPDDDYTDDYRSRAEWANWLRGAPFGPTDDRDNPGLGIPVDLVLAWHTDAGISRDGLIGTLAIYNVPGMDSTRVFPNGVSRLANRDLADGVQTSVVNDLGALYSDDWPRRPLWDRAYSEATRPTVPSLLLELLSHQNFRDMRHALDPRFRFDAARAVYKGVGRFLAEQRGATFVPQPLRPTHVYALLDGDRAVLGWRPQADPLEPDALPDAYVVYTRDGERGWDEGTRVEGTSARLPAPPVGVVRSYRVAGVNAGGEGRPSEALAVGRGAASTGHVLIVDGFDRVAGPETVDRRDRAGFVDPVGVPEGLGVVAVGAQRVFDPSAEYASDASPGWGASGGELEGRAIRGNDRDHAAAHGRALLLAGRSFASASDEAVASGAVALPGFAAVDLALGLEKRTPWPDPDDERAPAFEALPGALRARLGAYLDGGGALVVSGAHWASDAAGDPASAAWVRNRLGVEAAGVATPGEAPATRALAMEGTLVPFVTEYGPDHTAVRASDVLAPGAGARTVRFYGDYARPAAVAFGRTVSYAVPFEAVADDDLRAALMVHALGLAEGGQ
ncbi:xanthan lyase [Rubrivirga sp. IMCC43871]|uniref:golvesin C-terminal-like domain-containing protein n=1 Tax=Rubrivirga sp. IMCC43871 TaxID=3391575 RepID=UPI00398FD544